MAKPPGKCIFCGERKLTNEHVIPDWIRQIVPRGPKDSSLFTTYKSIDSGRHQNRIRSQTIQQGNPAAKKVRAVCANCNHGWLSTLEEELKPTLVVLVQGHSIELTPWKQRRLATWATKTAMTAEFLKPKHAGIKFEERERLRLHREPSANFDVFVGHYHGRLFNTSMAHHSGHFRYSEPVPNERTGPANSQATIILLGALFIQVTSTELENARFNLKDEKISKLRRIWPPSDNILVWPPVRTLSDDDISIILAGIDAAFAKTA